MNIQTDHSSSLHTDPPGSTWRPQRLKTIPDTPATAARPRRSRLLVHLAVAVVVKVILLALLWHAFIKPNKVTVDVDIMGSRIAGSASSVSQARIPTTPGDNP